MTALILARGIQGLGGGGLISLAQTIIADIVGLLDRSRLRAMFAANRDILIRTACVLGSTQIVTQQGAMAGDLTLAANALLLNMVFIAAFLLDGFAFAAETLVGQAIGARDKARLADAVRLSTQAAAIAGLVISLAILIGGGSVIALMTPNPEIRAAATSFLAWAAIMPLVAVWCFQLDGIFIGATRTVDMRNMMLVSFAVFLAALAVLVPLYANHGLWAALQIFYIVRAITLWWRYPRIPASL